MKRSEFKALSYEEKLCYLAGGRVTVERSGRKLRHDFQDCYYPRIRGLTWRVGKVRRKGYDTRAQALCAGHVLMRRFKAEAAKIKAEVAA